MTIDQLTPLTVDVIEKHTRSVKCGGRDRVRYRNNCPHCEHRDDFAFHDVRDRKLLVLIGGGVVAILIALARWKCRRCGHSFTDYPFFRSPPSPVRNSVAA